MLAAEGKTQEEIGAELGISHRMMKRHFREACRIGRERALKRRQQWRAVRGRSAVYARPSHAPGVSTPSGKRGTLYGH